MQEFLKSSPIDILARDAIQFLSSPPLPKNLFSFWIFGAHEKQRCQILTQNGAKGQKFGFVCGAGFSLGQNLVGVGGQRKFFGQYFFAEGGCSWSGGTKF